MSSLKVYILLSLVLAHPSRVVFLLLQYITKICVPVGVPVMKAGHLESCCHTKIAYLPHFWEDSRGLGSVCWLLLGPENITSQIRKGLDNVLQTSDIFIRTEYLLRISPKRCLVTL